MILPVTQTLSPSGALSPLDTLSLPNALAWLTSNLATKRIGYRLFFFHNARVDQFRAAVATHPDPGKKRELNLDAIGLERFINRYVRVFTLDADSPPRTGTAKLWLLHAHGLHAQRFAHGRRFNPFIKPVEQHTVPVLALFGPGIAGHFLNESFKCSRHTNSLASWILKESPSRVC